jgi:hypothetical protein
MSKSKTETKAKSGAAKSEQTEKTGTHVAVQEFSDYADSTDGTGAPRFKVGDDVSHLPESKLASLVEANLVREVKPDQEK